MKIKKNIHYSDIMVFGDESKIKETEQTSVSKKIWEN